MELCFGFVLFSVFMIDLSASLSSFVSCDLYADALAVWFLSSFVTAATSPDRLERWFEQ